MNETLQFYVFGNLSGECLFAPILERFLRNNRGQGGLIFNEKTQIHYSVQPSSVGTYQLLKKLQSSGDL